MMVRKDVPLALVAGLVDEAISLTSRCTIHCMLSWRLTRIMGRPIKNHRVRQLDYWSVAILPRQPFRNDGALPPPMTHGNGRILLGRERYGPIIHCPQNASMIYWFRKDRIMDDQGIRGSMEGSVRNAKATFAKIDEERLRLFIERQPDVPGTVALEDISYPTDGAGSSNGIAFFSIVVTNGTSVIRQKLVLRYSPGVQLLKQKKFADEFKTLRAVGATSLPVPHVLWIDESGEQLGQPGYIMEAIEGDTPSAAMYSKGPLANVTPEERRSRMLKAAEFHGRLRREAIRADRLRHLVDRGEGQTAIEKELNWWLQEVLFVNPETDAKVTLVRSLREWLIRQQPQDAYEPNLVHGDAQIANIIYANGDIAAVIDWELSYLGHNESDLALICFLTKAHHVIDVAVEGTPTDEEYIARFEEASGAKVQHWEYFRLLCMYRVMAVSSLSASYMPAFEQVWAFHREHMDLAWDAARERYGD